MYIGDFIGNWFRQSKLSSNVSDLNYHYLFLIVFLFFPTEFDPEYQRMKEERNKKLRNAFGNFFPKYYRKLYMLLIGSLLFHLI